MNADNDVVDELLRVSAVFYYQQMRLQANFPPLGSEVKTALIENTTQVDYLDRENVEPRSDAACIHKLKKSFILFTSCDSLTLLFESSSTPQGLFLSSNMLATLITLEKDGREDEIKLLARAYKKNQ